MDSADLYLDTGGLQKAGRLDEGDLGERKQGLRCDLFAGLEENAEDDLGRLEMIGQFTASAMFANELTEAAASLRVLEWLRRLA